MNTQLNNSLVKAAKEGRTQDVLALIAEGADVHVWGEEPLCSAAEGGYTETVKVLVAAGADVRANRNYAILWAGRNGYVDTLQALLGAENVFDAGGVIGGHQFIGLRLDGELIIAAGFYWYSLDEARKHYTRNRHAIKRIERIAAWAANRQEMAAA